MSRNFFPVIIATITKSRETLAEWADVAKDALVKNEFLEQKYQYFPLLLKF